MNSFNDKVIFVTGNSRSGTTMMMRILNNHSNVHTINESQFFEKYWSAQDEHKILNSIEAKALCNSLITRQRNGFFAKVQPKEFDDDVVAILSSITPGKFTRTLIYNAFIHYETQRIGKQIPCEKTPQNIFYIEEILALYPNAQIVNLVRDPRSILLSQKKKWQRKFLGHSAIPWNEVIRLRVNYHPFTISKLWNSSANAYAKHASDKRVKQVRFESLTAAPEQTVSSLCEWLDIPYEDQVLNIPHASSSTAPDRKEKGIKASNPIWQKHLSPTEVYICQEVCADGMSANGYEPIKIKPNFLALIYLGVIFPVKILTSLALNLSRMRNVIQTVSKRLNTA